LVAGRKITDIGTAFSVRADSSRLQVAVVEGQVSFGSLRANDNHTIHLTSGDMLVATANQTNVVRLASPALKSELGWRRGILLFYRKPLADAAQEFNRYNQQQIVIVGNAIGRLPVSGSLSATDPEQFVRMAKNVFGLRVERRDGEILISR
jgi:transmembrane sensor